MTRAPEAAGTSRAHERGQALPLVLGLMLIISVSVVTVLALSGASSRDAKRENSHDAALAVAEAGVANALSRLSRAPRPLAATALPYAGSPEVDAVSGGTVSWYGTLSGDTWTVTSTSSVPNPSGGGALSRAVAVDVRVGSTAMNPAWGYLYDDDPSGCLTLSGSDEVAEPLYTRGGLCLDEDAHVTGSPLHVEGTIQTTGSASVGASGAAIGELHVAGGCRYGASGSFATPCGPAEQVYATSQDAISAGIAKPPIDLQFWYANAKPGPLQACTMGSFPGGFDNDTALNRSRGSVELFGATNYDCSVAVGGTQLGRIAWTDGNPGTFVVDGTVFFDGDLDLASSAAVLYSGRGTIYASGHVTIAGGDRICGAWAATSCDFAGWSPATNMLVLVAGTSAESPAFAVSGGTEFQGGIYAVGDYAQASAATVQGPTIGYRLALAGTSQSAWAPFTYLPPGAPMEEPVVVTPGWRD
jgi:hypothetical protein